MRQLVEELVELVGALVLIVGMAWALAAAVPAPMSWPVGLIAGGLLLLALGQIVYFARTSRKSQGREVE